MNSARFILPPELHLNKNNYSDWIFRIKNELNTRELWEYTERDIVAEVANEVRRKTKNENDLKKAKTQDQIALSIIINNVSQEVIKKIERVEKTCEAMEIINMDYNKEKSKDVGYYLKKLDTLYAKNLDECMDIMREIENIFNILDEKEYRFDDISKMNTIYNAAPPEISGRIVFKEKMKPKDMLDQIRLTTVMLQLMANKRRPSKLGVKTKESQNPNKTNNYMDIDHVTHQKNVHKHCPICNNNTHNLNECRYNLKSEIHNKENKKNNNDKHRRRFRKYKKDKRYVGNVEEDDEYEYKDNGEDFYQEQKLVESIERFNDSECIISDNCKETNIDSECIISDNCKETNINSECIISDNCKRNNVKSECIISDDRKRNNTNSECIISDYIKEKSIPELNIIKNTDDQSGVHDDNKIITWTYDTGCSEHITCDKSILKNFKNEKTNMKCANNTICTFEGVGVFEGTINKHPIKLENVYYSKQINKNLLSGIKLANDGLSCEIESKNNKTWLKLKDVKKENKKVIGSFSADEFNIVRIPSKMKRNISINTITNDNTKTKLDDYSKKLWHQRLGHFYHENLEKYLDLHNVKEVECLDCQIAKLKRKTHNGTPPRASRKLETIHSDVIGPITKSLTGKRFILTFIDEFTRKAWIYPIERKSDVPKKIIQFLKYLKNQFNQSVKFFKSDNGKEFKNRKVENYCLNNGIKKIYSPPYNP